MKIRIYLIECWAVAEIALYWWEEKEELWLKK